MTTFKCTGCAKCCRTPHNIIFRSPLEAMVVTLAASRAEVDIAPLESPNGSFYLPVKDVCPMLDQSTNKCKVEEHKPKVCQSYPFTVEYMTDRAARLAIHQTCEGLDAPGGEEYDIHAQMQIAFGQRRTGAPAKPGDELPRTVGYLQQDPTSHGGS